MATDVKYGQVTTEFGSIGTDEPVFIFRAQDKILPVILRHYRDMCELAGAQEDHLDMIDEAYDDVLNWQVENGFKLPDS